MSSRFAAGIGKLHESSGKVAPHSDTKIKSKVVASADPVEHIEKETTSRWEQSNRKGKVVISAYFDPAVRKQLAILAVENDTTQAALMADALNLLFENYNRPPIAKG